MTEHLTREQLSSWQSQMLNDAQAAAVEAHLEVCDQCAALLDDAKGSDRFLDQVKDLLDTDIQSASHSELPAEEAGMMLGQYQLVELLGEGGMGRVWRAHQEQPIKRDVAIKIIKFGMDTREVIARFESERQAVAMMDHPNIARVLDAGATEAGRPFFVMELVGGKPVTQFCDEHQLSTDQRLKMFCEICSAIQHAHRRGIIHRDIKPSNVLVQRIGDEEAKSDSPVAAVARRQAPRSGERSYVMQAPRTGQRSYRPPNQRTHAGDAWSVKVIDFGLAKATDQRLTEKTLFTRMGQLVGTPAYMSPEQAAGQAHNVDTRTDVYSLGVLLYELLTGVTPLDLAQLQEAGYAEIQRLIQESDPPTPSTRFSSAHGDSAFVAQMRSTDPRSLVQLLRGDLDVIVMKSLEKERDRRYESPNEFAADVRRFLKREPIVARRAPAAYRLKRLYQRNRGLFLAVAAVVVTLLVATVASSWLAVRAIHAEDLANKRLTEVETEQQKTSAALKDSEAARAEADAEREKAEAVSQLMIDVFQSPRPEEQGVDVTVASLLDDAIVRLNRDLGDQPDKRAELKGIVASTYHSLSLHRKAATVYEELADFATTTWGEEDPRTLRIRRKLAVAYSNSGRPNEANEIYEELLPSYMKLFGLDDRQTLQTEYGLLNARANAGGTSVLDERRALLERCRQHLGDADKLTLQVMDHLGFSLSRAGRFDEAIELRTQLMELLKSTPETFTAIRNLRMLALALDHEGQYELAEEYAKQAQERASRVLGSQHYETFEARAHFADLALRQQDFEKSAELLQQNLASRRSQNPMGLHSMANSAESVISQLGLAGEHEEALFLGEELIASLKQKHSRRHPRVVQASQRTALAVLGRHGADQWVRRRATAIALEAHESAQPIYGGPQEVHGLAQYRNCDFAAARESLAAAIPKNPKSGFTRFLLAMTLWQLEEQEAAKQTLRDAEAWVAERDLKGAWIDVFRTDARELITSE